MTDTTTNTEGGATIGENVTTGHDFVGRDQVGSQVFIDNLEKFARWLGFTLTLAVALWSITYFLGIVRMQAETRQVEARRPFLEKQLLLYTETTQVTAQLATETNQTALQAALKRFWELYWGELSMVENGGVETAMINFGNCLKKSCSQAELKVLSYQVAHACRESLARSWGVQDWQTPTYGN